VQVDPLKSLLKKTSKQLTSHTLNLINKKISLNITPISIFILVMTFSACFNIVQIIYFAVSSVIEAINHN